MSEHENKPTDKLKIPEKVIRKLVAFALGLIFFLLIMGGSFLGYHVAYAQKIYPGMVIAGLEVGGLTPKQAERLVQARIDSLASQNLPVYIDGNRKSLKFSQLGLTFAVNETVQEAYAFGREQDYWRRIPRVLATLLERHSFVIEPKFDDKILEEKLNSLAAGSVKEAKNASLKVEDGQLVMVLPEMGRKIDLDKVKDDLINQVNNVSSSLAISLAFKNITPSITEKEVSQVKPLVEKVTAAPIYLFTENKRYLADRDEIASWVVLQANQQGGLSVFYSDDEIRSYLDYIAQKIDQKALPKKIRADNKEVLDEGQDGQEVDRDDALAKVKEVLSDRLTGQTETNQVELVLKVTPRKEKIIEPEDIDLAGGTPGLYEGKYLEIDLSGQILYCWEGSNQVCANQISTGKWSMPTPTGTRYIESKDERAYSSKYHLYMPWWNSIGGGYGIHELPEWANGYKEGEAHLGTPVSHGCIRLGVGAAEFVYHWAPEGTPVYIHK